MSYICEKCGYDFGSFLNLKRHSMAGCLELLNHELKNYICSTCERPEIPRFLQSLESTCRLKPQHLRNILYSHIRLCRANVVLNSKENILKTRISRQQLLTCGGCLTVFTDVKEFIDHVENFNTTCDLIQKSELEEETCAFCSKCYSSISDILEHISTGCKPPKSKKTSEVVAATDESDQMDMFNQIINPVETVVESLYCPLCPETYTAKDDFKHHLTNVHSLSADDIDSIYPIEQAPRKTRAVKTVSNNSSRNSPKPKRRPISPIPKTHEELLKTLESLNEKSQTSQPQLDFQQLTDLLAKQTRPINEIDFVGTSKRKSHAKPDLPEKKSRITLSPEQVNTLKMQASTIDSTDVLSNSFYASKRDRGRPPSDPNKEKTHSCEICGKGFSNSLSRDAHINSVHLNASFKCNLCPKSFKWQSSLSNHKRKAHANNYDAISNLYTVNKEGLSQIFTNS